MPASWRRPDRRGLAIATSRPAISSTKPAANQSSDRVAVTLLGQAVLAVD
jgi:hypothetical protein